MGRLRLHLLGPPEVHHDGEPLGFSTRKTLALLNYLVVEGIEGTTMQPREKLAALFWPESDSSRGRAALRNTLRYLREALPADEAGDTPHLVIERSALGFDFDSDYTLDLEIVDAAAGARDAVLLQEAVDAYRGDFLEGFSPGDAPDFDDWAGFQRELWHRQLDTVFDRLSQLYLDRGQTRSAVETATRWIAHDPVNETAYRRLMRAHFAAGDRTAALQTFETCEATLVEELNVEPAPGTKALATKIRQSVPERTADVPRPWTTQRSPLQDLPLVGRADELATLVERYHGAARGEPQAVTIIGEAGIGKSRLLDEFVRWAAAQDADVLQARGFETGTHLPYQTLLDPLRVRVDCENAPEDLLSDTWLAELSRLLPELRDRYPDLEMPARDDATARARLLEANARLLQALAARTPLVLAIDDVQWADAPSREALHYACRRCVDAGAPVLMVTTVRQEALDPLVTAQEPEIANWLRDLERAASLVRLTLTPLSEEYTLKLVQALTGAEEHGSGGAEEHGSGGVGVSSAPRHPGTLARFAEWLFSETDGHPFYLVETIKDLLERGHLREERDGGGNPRLEIVDMPDDAPAPGASPSVPDRVRRVITTRLSRLSAPAFALLAASAVLGHGLTFEILREVAGLDEDTGLTALDELLRSQLLREAADATLRP